MSTYKNTKYPFIYPKAEVYDASIDIEDVLLKISCPSNNHNQVCCPNGHKGNHKLTIHTKTSKNTNTCHCHNCGEFGGGPYSIALWYKENNWFEAKKWLSDEFGVEKVENPDYINARGDSLTDDKKALAQEKANKSQVVTSKTEKIEKKIEYLVFDENKEFIYIKDIEKFCPVSEIWNKMSDAQRLKVVYTYFYSLCFEISSQKPKYMYYKKRGLETDNRWIKKISYLAVSDFSEVLRRLLKKFPVEILEKVGIIKLKDESKEFVLSFSYVKKGGILVVPSFDMYSNMTTGFMLRPTHPERWMKDKGMKEIQLSNTLLVKPLPFGLTYHTLKKFDTFNITEGHPDGLAIPGNTNDEDDVGICSMAGANGLVLEQLGVFKNKKIKLWLDQDEAGKKAAFGYREIVCKDLNELYINTLQDKSYELSKKSHELNNIKFMVRNHKGLRENLINAGAIDCSVEIWDTRFGSDLNDVKQNGNIKQLFKTTV